MRVSATYLIVTGVHTGSCVIILSTVVTGSANVSRHCICLGLEPVP